LQARRLVYLREVRFPFGRSPDLCVSEIFHDRILGYPHTETSGNELGEVLGSTAEHNAVSVNSCTVAQLQCKI